MKNNTKIGNNNGKRFNIKRFSLAMMSAVIIFLAFSFGSVAIVYAVVFPRYDRPAVSADAHYELFADSLPRREVFFESGENTLAGYIYGEENDLGLIVVAHGMGSGADTYIPHIKYFLEQGWRVFSFDFTGSYGSEGDSVRGFAQGIYDIDAALDYIEASAEFDGLPVMLFGHSWGGFSACAVSAYEKHNISGIVSVAAPDCAEEIMLNYAQKYVSFFAYTQIPFLKSHEAFLFGGAASLTATDGINAAGVPALLFHSSNDIVVPFDISAASRVQASTNKNVTCELLDRGHTELLYDSTSWELREKINSGLIEESYANLRDANKINIPLMDKINNFYLSLIA